MTTITDARAEVVSVLVDALPGVPVYGAPPNNVSAPCALVGLGGADTQPTMHRWGAELVVVLVAPGGDNTAAVEWLESALMTAAQALASSLVHEILWDEPGQTTIAGTPYLAARLRVPVDLGE